jgi:hypothetical protein
MVLAWEAALLWPDGDLATHAMEIDAAAFDGDHDHAAIWLQFTFEQNTKK